MDERERDYLRQQIGQLQRSNRRWKLATLSLAAALAIFLIGGALSSLFYGVLGVQRLREESMMLQVEQARAMEAAARQQAEQAVPATPDAAKAGKAEERPRD